MSNTAVYNVTVSEQIQTLYVTLLEDTHTFNASLDTAIELVTGEQYEGEYTVTPSNQAITLNTTDKTLVDNIVVNPIPSNYGLISWNGAILTVS